MRDACVQAYWHEAPDPVAPWSSREELLQLYREADAEWNRHWQTAGGGGAGTKRVNRVNFGLRDEPALTPLMALNDVMGALSCRPITYDELDSAVGLINTQTSLPRTAQTVLSLLFLDRNLEFRPVTTATLRERGKILRPSDVDCRIGRGVGSAVIVMDRVLPIFVTAVPTPLLYPWQSKRVKHPSTHNFRIRIPVRDPVAVTRIARSLRHISVSRVLVFTVVPNGAKSPKQAPDSADLASGSTPFANSELSHTNVSEGDSRSRKRRRSTGDVGRFSNAPSCRDDGDDDADVRLLSNCDRSPVFGDAASDKSDSRFDGEDDDDDQTAGDGQEDDEVEPGADVTGTGRPNPFDLLAPQQLDAEMSKRLRSCNAGKYSMYPWYHSLLGVAAVRKMRRRNMRAQTQRSQTQQRSQGGSATLDDDDDDFYM